MDSQIDSSAGNPNEGSSFSIPQLPFTSIVVGCSNDAQSAAVYAELLKRRTSGRIPSNVKLFSISDPMGCRVGSGGALLHCLQHTGSQIVWSKGMPVQVRSFDVPPAPLSSVLAALSSEKILLIHSGGDSRRCTTLSVCGKVWADFPVLVPPTLFDAVMNTLSHFFFEVEMGSCVMACSDVFFDVTPAFYEHHPMGILPFFRKSLKDVNEDFVLVVSLPVHEDIATRHAVVWVKGYPASPVMTDGVRKVDNLIAKPSLDVVRLENKNFHNASNGYALVDVGIAYYPWRCVSALTSLAYEEEMHFCTSIGLNASTVDRAMNVDAFSDFISPFLFNDILKAKEKREMNGNVGSDVEAMEKGINDAEEAMLCEKYVTEGSPSEAYQRVRRAIWKALSKFSLYTFITSDIHFCHVGSIVEFQEFVQKLVKKPVSRKQVVYWYNESNSQSQFASSLFEMRFFSIQHPLVALTEENSEDSSMCVYNSVFTYPTKKEAAPTISGGIEENTTLLQKSLCYGQLGRYRHIGKNALVEHSNIEGPFYLGSSAFVSCVRSKGLREGLCVLPRIVLQEVCVNTRKLDKGILTHAIANQMNLWEYVTSICGLSDQLKLQCDQPAATICNASWETFFLCLQCCSINLSHTNLWEGIEKRQRCLWNARLFVSYRYTSSSPPCSLWMQYLSLIEHRITEELHEDVIKDNNIRWVTGPKLALCQNLLSEYHLEGAIRRWSVSSRLSFSDILRLSDPECELMWRNRVMPFVIEKLAIQELNLSNGAVPVNFSLTVPFFNSIDLQPNLLMTSVPYSSLLVEHVLINNSEENLLDVCYNSGLRDKVYLVTLLYSVLQPSVIKQLTEHHFFAIRCIVLIYVILESLVSDLDSTIVNVKHRLLMSALERFHLSVYLTEESADSLHSIIAQLASVTCKTLQQFYERKKGGTLATSTMHSTLTGDDELEDEDSEILKELASLAFLNFYVCKLFIHLTVYSSLPPLRRIKDAKEIATGHTVRVEAPCRADIGGGWCDIPFVHSTFNNPSVTNFAITFDGHPALGVTCKRTDTKGIRLVLLQRYVRKGSLIDNEIGSTLLTSCEQLKNFESTDTFRLLKGSMCTLCLLLNGEGDTSKKQEILNIEQVYSRFFDGSYGGLEIRSSSCLPIGSGMGSSSILSSCVIQAVGVSIGLVPENRLDLIYLTLMTEQYLQTCGGWQDPIGGIYPGIKCTTQNIPTLLNAPNCSLGNSFFTPVNHFSAGEETTEVKNSCSNVKPYDLRVKELPISPSFLKVLNSRMLFVSTGSRVAQHILDKTIARWHGVYSGAREVLQRINTTSEQATSAILREDIVSLGSVLTEYFDLKRMFTGCPEVEDITLILEKIKPFIHGSCLCGAGFCGFLICLTKSDEAEVSIRRIVEELSVFTIWKASISQDGMTTVIET